MKSHLSRQLLYLKFEKRHQFVRMAAHHSSQQYSHSSSCHKQYWLISRQAAVKQGVPLVVWHVTSGGSDWVDECQGQTPHRLDHTELDLTVCQGPLHLHSNWELLEGNSLLLFQRDVSGESAYARWPCCHLGPWSGRRRVTEDNRAVRQEK